MKEKFRSILGSVFEGAFKVGLLEVVKPKESEKFKSNFINSLDLEDYHREILKNDQESWRKIGTYIDDQNAEEIYLKTLYLIGHKSGRLYGKSYKEMVLIKYHLGDESSEPGVWKNADLIFIHNQTLYVVDFKLSNATSWIRKYLEKATRTNEGDLPFIPAINFGVPVNISVGELSFVKFIEKYLEIQNALENLQDAFIEIKGFTQVLSYAVDYLCEKEVNDLREVCLELIYPLPEPYRARFYLNRGDEQILYNYRKKVKEIYENLKEKEKFENEIETLERNLETLEKDSIRLKVDDISKAREDVTKSIDEFVKVREPASCLILLHSAGSGKTSQARKKILSEEGNHIVIYMASRIILLQREYDEIKKTHLKLIKLILDPRVVRQLPKKVVHTGKGYESKDKKKGKLKSLIESINDAIYENKYRWIWGLTTTQTIVETKFGETSKHFNELFKYKRILKEYTFHIIVDEFLGARNGLYAIEEVLKFAKKVKEENGNIKVYIFDANGYSPPLMKKLLQEYKAYGVIPDSLVLSDYEEEVNLEYDSIPIKIRAKHGYPSKELTLSRKFLKIEQKKEPPRNELAKKIRDYVVSTFKDKKNKTAFLYIQDKELIIELSTLFEVEGLSTTIATASSRKSQEEINEGTSDIIIGTSSITRGIDLSRPTKPVDYIYIIVFDWDVEQNLVEILQAISRARGDQNTESNPKKLHLVFPIMPLEDYVIDNIKSLMEIDDDDLVKKFYILQTLKEKILLSEVTQKIVSNFLTNPPESQRVIVPIPAQHKSTYNPNRISDLESIITFLEDVYLMEQKRKNQKAIIIKSIKEELIRAITLSARAKKDEERPYYHPYLLIKDGEITLTFDNEKRNKIKSLLDEMVETLLSEHNEEKFRKLKEFIDETPSVQLYKMDYLIPVYSFIFTEKVLEESKFMRFKIRKRVGRGGADTLGGAIKFFTRCFKPKDNTSPEYAMVPLGENYPYLEVLSGRFAKFPIEFITKLVEK